MPKIATPTLALHRQWRREGLLEVATNLILEERFESLSIAKVAQAAGVSRTLVYEYFGNNGELIADVVLKEMADFAEFLDGEICALSSNLELCLQKWVELNLNYVADGRHLIARAMYSVDIDSEKSRQIRTKHLDLVKPISKVLENFGVVDIDIALSLMHAAIESAAKRIENGGDAAREIQVTSAFCIAGLHALI
ncbi:MAG: hypothetical protein RLZZ545_816 [Actinomycetota bacterium]